MRNHTTEENMDGKDTKPVIALKRHIQKYVQTLLSDIKEMKSRETDSKKEVASLANLLEQRECVANVDVVGLTLATLFPDVQPRLLVNISAEVDAKLDKLKDLIEPLRRHSAVAYKARCDALTLIRKYSDDLNMHTLTAGQPTIPPLTVMLDWIDVVEKKTREIYYTRLYYLENIVDQEIVKSDCLVTLWSEDIPALLNIVQDCEEQSRYFLEEKFQ
uniref:Uncharacterized protein n=1 Tax=Arion vulgaris TaxID=1028688 RepID=A0A0B7ACP3_9EUPU